MSTALAHSTQLLEVICLRAAMRRGFQPRYTAASIRVAGSTALPRAPSPSAVMSRISYCNSKMDADEALARRLQAEEDAAAAVQRQAVAHQLRGSTAGKDRIIALLRDATSKALGYEDELAQAMALSVMPLDSLVAAAHEACAVSAAMGEVPVLAREDALAQELLGWFKGGFFSWVDSPPCASCGAAATSPAGMAAPSAEDVAHGAGRVELHRCQRCGTTTRFPRYNDPVKLLETRRGRCGEWANAFTLCCRAAGLDVRLAVDLEDHVWTEQWSEAQQKWVHLDPCEAAYDKPLLYEAGWGKRLSYVLAVGRHGAADVTRRYTRRWDEVLRKRGLVTEAWLEGCMRDATSRLRAQLPPGERQLLEQRDALDQQHLLSSDRVQLAPAELAALPARTTGDAAWLAARGEDGRDGAAAQQVASAGTAAAPAAPAEAAAESRVGTRYRPAKDEGLAGAEPLRLCGGAVRASGENAPSEVARCAFDGSPGTKWLDFGGGGKARNAAWLEYRLPAEQQPVLLASYALTSANDCPERDPRHVVLEAWAEEAATWVTVDEQTNLSFLHRHHRLHLHIGTGSSNPAAAVGAASVSPSRRFRLRVVSVADPAAASCVQLACLDLYRRPLQAQQAAQEQAAAGHAAAAEGQAATPGLAAAGQAAAGQVAQEQAAQEQTQVQPPPGAGVPQLENKQPPGAVSGKQEAQLEEGVRTLQLGDERLPAASGNKQEAQTEGDNPWAALFTAV